MNWVSHHYTDTGSVRKINEDSVLPLDAQNLWAVADGMGGHDSGDYASQLLVKQLANYELNPKPANSLLKMKIILDKCNTELVQKASQDKTDIVGCTVAILTMHVDRIICTWCGDSRIYRIREGKLLQLTRDHSHQCLAEDRDVIRFPRAIGHAGDMLTAAIGGDAELQVEQCTYGLKTDDVFILCTDGLYKEVTNAELLEIASSEENPSHIIRKLSELYFGRGARDNIGIVLVASDQADIAHENIL